MNDSASIISNLKNYLALKKGGLTLVCAALLLGSPAQAERGTHQPSSGAAMQDHDKMLAKSAQEFRKALDARVEMESHRTRSNLFVHIDDLIARFIHAGMLMSDAEAIARQAGLRLSTIDVRKSDGAVLFTHEYSLSRFSSAFAVITIYPKTGHQEKPAVARAAAQINFSTL